MVIFQKNILTNAEKRVKIKEKSVNKIFERGFNNGKGYDEQGLYDW